MNPRVFSTYSKYYDLIYKDKDYAAEVEYVHNLIKRYVPGARNIIELGCGTGRHASILAQKGYNIEGVDFSETMLTEARKRYPHIVFHFGDIRDLELGNQADAVISLFHVMSYQTTNEDLQKVFYTAKVHLRDGGLFVFDCWYGPAVLSDKPTVRIKRVDDNAVSSIIRIAEPVMWPNQNVVDVNYHILITDKKTKMAEEIKETHRMRYLFYPEIELLCSQVGLEVIDAFEWLTDKSPGFESWSVCFVVRK